VHVDIALARPRSLAEIRHEMEEVRHVLIGANRLSSGLVNCRQISCPRQPDAFTLWFRTVSFDLKRGQADYSYEIRALRGNGTTCADHLHESQPTTKVRYHRLRLVSLAADIFHDDSCELSRGEVDDRLKVIDGCIFADLRADTQAA